MPGQPSFSEGNIVAATAMFVEVLVVGIGTLAALFILIASSLGIQQIRHLSDILGSPLAVSLGLAFAYTLGILVDRAMDISLSPIRRHLRAIHFPSGRSYTEARISLARDPTLVARAEYARSRMRVCRGWLFNAVVGTAAIDVLITQVAHTREVGFLILATSLGLALITACFATWWSITATGYRKLAEQAMLLR
ncbi:hypothetical protein RMN57_04840 [Kitasatospora sp. CM 4170]|uniref:Uncharacterized protein n=1 Tax=Kitasatospora aburaviensis TaxID=67265 RepID=A0ABW1EU44_9ACTN|nr:hypothetical protein [Kitasatospora sp. CM 4170]WNM44087.1 hypothetical protein RMN57_04840 [Kitasatospora sp. CM 4170]